MSERNAGRNEWTTEQRRVAFTMRTEGCSIPQRAVKIGKSNSAVKQFLSRAKITKAGGYKREHESTQLCWDCWKASGGGDCEWANSKCRRVVPGWKAEVVPARGYHPGEAEKGPWYEIKECPKFEREHHGGI